MMPKQMARNDLCFYFNVLIPTVWGGNEVLYKYKLCVNQKNKHFNADKLYV